MDIKYCRFISISNKLGCFDSFKIADGGSIFIDEKEKTVRYIDSYHIRVDCWHFHIEEFFEIAVLKGGCIVQPGKLLMTKEYGSNFRAYGDNTYRLVKFPELGDTTYQYTDLHVIRETLPLGMYAYDIKFDDENIGVAVEIAENVGVNHLGTIITKYPLMDRGQSIYLKQGFCFVNQNKEEVCV